MPASEAGVYVEVVCRNHYPREQLGSLLLLYTVWKIAVYMVKPIMAT